MSFESVKTASGQPSSHVQSTVTISQVVTDIELVSRSTLLEATLSSGRYTEFCDKKISLCKDKTESTIWSFLKVREIDDAVNIVLLLIGAKINDLG